MNPRPHKRTPSVPTAESKVGYGDHADLVLTPVRELPGDRLKWCIETAACVAFDLNEPAIAVGVDAEGYLLVCDTGCCHARPGVVVVVPDVCAAEMISNGHDVTERGKRMTRSDGRTAYLFAGSSK